MSLLRVFAISDLHTDIKQNLDWIKDSLETVHAKSSFNILIVAGDVSDRSEVILETFALFSRCFDVVFFTPGNHDVWVTSSCGALNSFEKHLRICQALESSYANVFCRPLKILIKARGAQEDDVTPTWSLAIIPILGWHDERFDLEPEIPSSEIGGKDFPRISQVVSDRTKAKFPITDFMEEKQANASVCDTVFDNAYYSLLQAFNIKKVEPKVQNWDSSLVAWKLDQLNSRNSVEVKTLETIHHPSGYSLVVTDISASISSLYNDVTEWEEVLGPNKCDKIVTFSHFLPFPFLNPEKRFLFYPFLAKVIGSQYLANRLFKILPDIHVFGHTHFGWNASLREMLAGQGLVEFSEQNALLPDALRPLLNCRFVQAPLGYPRERQMRLKSMAVGSFNSGETERFYFVPLSLNFTSEFVIEKSDAYWSSYYCRTPRDPNNTHVADYVKQIYMHQS